MLNSVFKQKSFVEMYMKAYLVVKINICSNYKVAIFYTVNNQQYQTI